MLPYEEEDETKQKIMIVDHIMVMEIRHVSLSEIDTDTVVERVCCVGMG